MDVEILPIDAFDPRTDVSKNWVWVNSWGDGGAVVLFHNRIVHMCAKANEKSIHSVKQKQLCPNRCGIAFFPTAWDQTRKIHGI